MAVPKKLATSTPLFCCLLMLVNTGCGSKYPPTAPVSGKITINGKPVTQGRISFHPITGERPALGNIQPDGSYSLTTFQRDDGALLGIHKVSIKSTRIENSAPKDFQEEAAQATDMAKKGGPQLVFIVDKKYYDERTTDLEAEVKPGDNHVDFKLPDSGSPSS